MKKIILTIIVLIAFATVLILIPNVKAIEKVPIYMFTKEGCSACEYALEYFETLKEEEKDSFDLVVIEVFDKNWNANSEEVKDLLLKVYERFEEDTSKVATPTIVIGDYHSIGLSAEELKKAINDAKNSKEYVDEVKKIADDLNINIDSVRKSDKEDNKESGKYDTIIIISIFVILIGGFVGLVLVSRK